MPLEVARARLAASRDPDRFEREAGAFFERVRAAYLARVQAHPERVRVIDGSQPMQAVRARLEAELGELLA